MNMTEVERQAVLASIASLLVTRGPWTVADRNGYLRIVSAPILTSFCPVASGPSLWVRFEAHDNKGKLAVNVNWPMQDNRELFPREGDRVSGINISLSKSPAQIAADIERRLLPAYLAQWDKQLAEVERHNEYEKKRHDAHDLVAQLTGGHVIRDPNDKTRVNVDWPNSGSYDRGYVANLQISADSMQFEVRSVPISVGINILKLIQEAGGSL